MDEILFNDIYDKYVNIVWRTAKYYSENETDADEITQLTFVNLLISYEKIRNKNAIEASHNRLSSGLQPDEKAETGDAVG